MNAPGNEKFLKIEGITQKRYKVVLTLTPIEYQRLTRQADAEFRRPASLAKKFVLLAMDREEREAA